ncbi:MAG: phosphoglycerate kinase [Chloroflexi bacterium]|nr:phosphoglycerate kinase [Chloroflexota bacterium]
MKKTVSDIDVSGARCLVRVDFNVPFEPGTTTISDDSRIRAALPTINYLRERGARVILATHVGRPKGIDDALRVAPMAARLSELIESPVTVAPDSIGDETQQLAAALGPGDVLFLENTRFHPEEEKNDPDHSAALASLADIFVNDAFGSAHRAHASTEGVAHILPAVAGFLLDKEIRMLGSILESPRRPLATLMGGAKVGDKMAVMERLIETSDMLLVGGGMAAAFLEARGLRTGKSLLEDDGPLLAARIESAAKARGIQLLIPTDVVVASELSAEAEASVVSTDAIPADKMLLDIGPATRDAYTRALRLCQTILWNGPMGVFEFQQFAAGTRAIGETLAQHAHGNSPAPHSATTRHSGEGRNPSRGPTGPQPPRAGATVIVGGGSTAEAVDSLGLADAMTHVSTGGGAALEFLEGRALPGIAALQNTT